MLRPFKMVTFLKFVSLEPYFRKILYNITNKQKRNFWRKEEYG